MFNNQNNTNNNPRPHTDTNSGNGRKPYYRDNKNRNGNSGNSGRRYNHPFEKGRNNRYTKNVQQVNQTYTSENPPVALEQGKLRVIPIGGVEKIGINTMAIEYGDDLILIDMGMGFPDEKEHGVDLQIPNYAYVKENISKLRGVVITHGHLDHIGAIPYVIKDLGFPLIYSGKLASELIREKVQEFALQDSIRIQEVTSLSKYNLGVFEISYFRVNHNIPDAFGVIVKTPVGTIVHTGDFKFDLTPYREPVTEFSKIANVGSEGVLLLCSDSTNACRMGWSESESSVTPDLTRLVNEAQGRVLTATFSTLITRMAQIVEIAHKAGRKVVMLGRSIETTVRIAKELGLIKVPMEAFITVDQAKHTPDNELLIMVTGTQGEESAVLSRMASGNHRDFDVKTTDTIILSSSFIPGNENKINRVIGKLAKIGATVYHSHMMNVHASGHACAEDHKMLLHLCKPKYLMPIHGEFTDLLGQKATAVKVGMAPENVILTENGTTIDFDQIGFTVAGKTNAAPLLVDGNMMGDITPQLLMDREQLGEDGILVAVINGQEVNILTRGFIEVKENQNHINAITELVKKEIDKENGIIEGSVKTYITETIGRNPIVVVYKKGTTNL
jgi:ribonuclease J